MNIRARVAAGFLIALLAFFEFLQQASPRDITNLARMNRAVRGPQVFLWAWERREDLTFIRPDKIGVAYLAQSLHLRGDNVVVRPRLQPLKIPAGTTLIAVTRIESDRVDLPSLTVRQAEEVVTRIEATARTVAGVQLDFDAKLSERQFYRHALEELRKRLPKPVTLSVTALASWCTYDDWLRQSPVDEVVPMLFRMGPERQQVLALLQRNGDFRCLYCRQSVGISTDEPVSWLPRDRRVYVFNPAPWSRGAVERTLQELNR